MKKLNFTKTVKNTFLGKFFILGLLSTSSFLNAQVFNVNFAPLNFSANNQSVITGTLNAANSQVLYTNVITINGQVMDCIVTNLDGSTTFDQDWRSNPNAAPGNTTDALRVDSMFSPILSNTMSGSSLNVFKRFKFDFVTKFGSNTFYSPVILDNVVLNVYDVDREGTGNIKNSVKISKGNYNTFEAISTSVGYNNTDPDMLSFYQSNPSSNTNTTYAGVIADAHRYRFTFSNLTSFEISLGEERTSGGNSTTITSNYFLAFSRGTGFSSVVIPANIVVDLNTNDPSVNNTAMINNNNAYNFTVGSQNITISDPQNLTSRINGINVAYPSAHIINNSYESLIINGGNLTIDLSNPTSTTFTLNSKLYTLNVSSNSGINTLRFTTTNNGTDTMTRVQAETLLDAMQYQNASIIGDEVGFRNFTVNATGTYIASGTTYALVSPPAIFIANIYVPLPVKIIRFVAKPVSASNVLEWDVAEEVNFSHYEIFRSKNGTEYISIGTVYSLNGSDGFKQYAFVDNNPLEGLSYYKLKLVDHDGNGNWSSPTFINRTIDISNQVSLFPNPSNAIINVSLNELELVTYTVTVQDLMGKVVYTQNMNDVYSNNFSLDVRGLDHGIYILKIADENGIVSINRFSKN